MSVIRMTYERGLVDWLEVFNGLVSITFCKIPLCTIILTLLSVRQ